MAFGGEWRSARSTRTEEEERDEEVQLACVKMNGLKLLFHFRVKTNVPYLFLVRDF